ncbi:MAG: UDP-glucose/GDP-mannose dehydrogenase family protein [Planctomycetota bacterium]
MKVSIIGTGYVGLVTGTCLAEKGHQVVCVDVDRSKVDKINRGEPPIHEAGLPELLARNIGTRLRATVQLEPALLETDLTLVAAPTPFDGREIDLRFVREIAAQAGRALAHKQGYHVVVVKSTVVPGTTDDVVLPILEQSSGKQAGIDFGIGMNPEFLSEGEAVRDFMHPDRIVLGGIDARTIDALDGLYQGFTGVERLRTNNRTAETIKYASNALQATMISFANEIGNLCARLGGVDVVDVLRGVHLMKELTPVLADGTRVRAPITSFLGAGCGFGGSCFPKDVKAIIAHAKKLGERMRLLEAVIDVNREQPRRMLALLRKHFASLAGVRVAVLGIAFKPDTDDMRESPAIPIIDALLGDGAQVQAYDPAAGDEARRVFAGKPVTICGTLDECLAGSQAALLVTRWEEFRSVPERLHLLAPPRVLVDGRRMLDKHSVACYEGIGT